MLFAAGQTCAGQADNSRELLQTRKLARRGQDPTSSDVDSKVFLAMYTNTYIPTGDAMTEFAVATS